MTARLINHSILNIYSKNSIDKASVMGFKKLTEEGEKEVDV